MWLKGKERKQKKKCCMLPIKINYKVFFREKIAQLHKKQRITNKIKPCDLSSLQKSTGARLAWNPMFMFSFPKQKGVTFILSLQEVFPPWTVLFFHSKTFNKPWNLHTTVPSATREAHIFLLSDIYLIS